MTYERAITDAKDYIRDIVKKGAVHPKLIPLFVVAVQGYIAWAYLMRMEEVEKDLPDNFAQ